MAKFRKKPVEIEAVQYDGKNGAEIWRWAKDRSQNPIAELVSAVANSRALLIGTLEGEMTASIGDWIICGVKCELYPCKPDIFEQTYEPA